MAAVLTVTETKKGDISIITPAGEIDAKTAPQFREVIDAALASGARKIAFDFSGLAYISSAGIGVLNAALHVLKERGGVMTIGAPTKTVKDTLDVMYFSKKAGVYPTIELAVKGLEV